MLQPRMLVTWMQISSQKKSKLFPDDQFINKFKESAGDRICLDNKNNISKIQKRLLYRKQNMCQK